MIASRKAFGRNVRVRKKRMADPCDPNESVSKQRLRTDFWREGAEHADLQIDQPLPEWARILLRLRREAQADARRGLGDSGDQGSRKGGYKPLVGSNGEGPFERSDIQLRDARAENRQHVPAEFMDALAQLGSIACGHEPATSAYKQRIARCRPEPCQRPAHGGR